MTFEGANLLSKIFLFYCRKISNHPSKLRIVNLVHSRLKNLIVVKAFNNTLLRLTPKDYISGEIIFNNIYEPISLNSAINTLKDSDGWFVDVGANIGLYSNIIANNFPDKKIIAIEPQPDNYAGLVENLELNALSLKNLHALNIAVGAVHGLIQMEKPLSNNNGAYRVVIDAQLNTSNAYYPMLTLDTVFKSLKVDNISLMKIDVEGFEMEAFKGINWEESYKPKNILMEYSDYVSRTGTNSGNVMQYLLARGYTPYLVNHSPYYNGCELIEDNLLFRLI